MADVGPDVLGESYKLFIICLENRRHWISSNQVLKFAELVRVCDSSSGLSVDRHGRMQGALGVRRASPRPSYEAPKFSLSHNSLCSPAPGPQGGSTYRSAAVSAGLDLLPPLGCFPGSKEA